MNRPRIWRGACLALLVTTAAAPASAKPMVIWAKDAGASAAMLTDLTACEREAKDVHATYQMAYVPLSPGGLLAAALVGGVAQGIQQHKARLAHVAHCMRGRGYAGIPLTPQEEAQANSQKSPAAAAAWTTRFYASEGFAARAAAAARPVVPPLPEAADEPLTYGGVRFDPARLTAYPGVILKGSPLLGGKVAHRRTARLASGVELHHIIKLDGEADAVFHEVVLPGDDDPKQTYWCGPMTSHPLAGSQHLTVCAFTNEEGYVVDAAVGQPWLAGSLIERRARPPEWKSAAVTLGMAPSAEDLLGPLDFTLILKKIEKGGVGLEAVATRDGKSVTFWKGETVFDTQGKAIVPFWSHRLALTRSGAGVTAAFTSDGDGSGWDDVKAAS
ncbi:MAG: hypothetical protein H0X27_11230 [Caulobacteraceae bacterium]|nr:hypothetical protein [Caulobacteraceae bacterium]